MYQIISDQKFLFRGTEYNVGDCVKVSKHYAGYKRQYPFMIGYVYIDKNVPKVRIEIPETDREQNAVQQLECWTVIEKFVKPAHDNEAIDYKKLLDHVVSLKEEIVELKDTIRYYKESIEAYKRMYNTVKQQVKNC